ncbi:hypothetical protein [Parachryseolinea silvisoli]|uniref:hypothetical protein n=1 Tax=Parachryseolinea silvisoli TaxID=2873601 RepID=UPI002265C86C|nr:hypothetical protein [Parachryseolinea silvisoli]MCD9014603.1 hypothetical protein [Parachryseolinea silvisoli]
MASAKYEAEVQALIRMAEIAIDAFKKFPHKDWPDKDVKQFIHVYTEEREGLLNRPLQYRNLKSLCYTRQDMLIYFQEGAGEAVNYFWEQVKLENLGIKRENKMAKILKRGRIKDQIEYDFVIDVLVPYQQEGLITESGVVKINEMIAAFEKKRTT